VNKSSLLPALLLCAGLLLPAAATGAENLGAHRTANPAEFQQVIEKKCIVCHTQERIDIAIKARRNLEKIQQRMIERGADLTERDKWGRSGDRPCRRLRRKRRSAEQRERSVFSKTYLKKAGQRRPFSLTAAPFSFNELSFDAFAKKHHCGWRGHPICHAYIRRGHHDGGELSAHQGLAGE
jgi:hypothetical protein